MADSPLLKALRDHPWHEMWPGTAFQARQANPYGEDPPAVSVESWYDGAVHVEMATRGTGHEKRTTMVLQAGCEAVVWPTGAKRIVGEEYSVGIQGARTDGFGTIVRRMTSLESEDDVEGRQMRRESKRTVWGLKDAVLAADLLMRRCLRFVTEPDDG